MTFAYKTQPFDHQRATFEATRDRTDFALFFEMGTGKTKVVLDTIAWLHGEGKIRGVLVLAPKGVVPNWVADEIPAHLPDDAAASSRVLLWDTARSRTRAFQAEAAEFLAHDGLAILCMSYDGIMTERSKADKAKGIKYRGLELAQALLKSRPCMQVLDESHHIKEPKTKRTVRVLASGRHAAYRRILTGTPVANSPFDVFAQLKFLDPTVWNALGCRTFAAFKSRFGIWEEHVRNDNGRVFKKLIQYRDLDILNSTVDRMGSRLLLEDVLDLPPKLYSKRYFDLTPAQAKLYNDLRRDFMVWLDSGELVTAPLMITRMLRFQQITSGYVPSDDGTMVRVDPNPRIGLFRDVAADIPHSFIVWAKFQEDIDQLMGALDSLGIQAVQYDGRTKSADREHARNAFQAGDIQAFVANPACAGAGLTLHRAKTVVYYNSSFKLTDRLQSENRAHRAGMSDKSVTYIDLIATNTIDAHIVRALRDKNDLAAIITGDRIRNWI